MKRKVLNTPIRGPKAYARLCAENLFRDLRVGASKNGYFLKAWPTLCADIAVLYYEGLPKNIETVMETARARAIELLAENP